MTTRESGVAIYGETSLNAAPSAKWMLHTVPKKQEGYARLPLLFTPSRCIPFAEEVKCAINPSVANQHGVDPKDCGSLKALFFYGLRSTFVLGFFAMRHVEDTCSRQLIAGLQLERCHLPPLCEPNAPRTRPTDLGPGGILKSIGDLKKSNTLCAARYALKKKISWALYLFTENHQKVIRFCF